MYSSMEYLQVSTGARKFSPSRSLHIYFMSNTLPSCKYYENRSGLQFSVTLHFINIHSDVLLFKHVDGQTDTTSVRCVQFMHIVQRTQANFQNEKSRSVGVQHILTNETSVTNVTGFTR
jgi:hypothetical protein